MHLEVTWIQCLAFNVWYFTERMTAALHSLDDRLPDEKNPAMLLLEYARAMSAR